MDENQKRDFDKLISGAQLLAFPDVSRKAPLSISVEEAITNFLPTIQIYEMGAAMEQAGRCGDCSSPFCKTGQNTVKIGCPLENSIPTWLQLLARGQVEQAIAEAFRTNPMPDVTGAVCPHKDLCEGSCVLELSGWDAVTIGGIERLLGETAWKYNLVPPIAPKNMFNDSIGIIGSGPAGYAVATVLAELGHHVTVYERSPKPGGLLAYGIPGFKLHKDVVTRYFNRLAAASNVEILTDLSVGQPVNGETRYDYIPFSGLVEKHDAIIIATGTYRPKSARLDGDAASAVIPALDYLTVQNFHDEGRDIPGFEGGWMNAKGKRVIVVGGGDTMIDCLRTARRQGAADVKTLYYRGESDIPANKKDFKLALKEGANVEYFKQAKSISQGKDGVYHVTIAHTELTGLLDDWGKPAIREIEGSKYEIEADMIISAVGFNPEHLPSLFNVDGMRLNENGTLNVTPIDKPKFGRTGAGIVGRAFTDNANALVLAVGDVVMGPDLVATNLRAGKEGGRFVHDSICQPGKVMAKYGPLPYFNLTAL